jgi:hypothetical protein
MFDSPVLGFPVAPPLSGEDSGAGPELVMLVEGGIVWVVVPVDPSPVAPLPSLDVSIGGVELVVPWGVDVDGAVVVELDVGLVVVVVGVDAVVELVVEVDELVDGVVEVEGGSVVARQWSSFPFELPCSSHSWPFVFGSVRHAVVLVPCEQSSPGEPGGEGGLSTCAAEA